MKRVGTVGHLTKYEHDGFSIYLDPWGNGEYALWLYDERWNYDFGQIGEALRRKDALEEAEQHCDAIRKFPSLEAYLKAEEESDV